jgi:TRAP-type mannitol/chloroaromatic compound transport system permease small subunit
MITIIQSYIALQRREYNLLWLFLIYILLPAILSWIVYMLFKDNIWDLFKSAGSDIITMFSIINGFLLSSISIVISNTSITKEEAIKRSIDFEKIVRMRKIMMYDILFQILFIIPLCLLIIYIKSACSNTYLSYFTVYLWFISISIMTILAKRFMYYQAYMEKNN